MKQQQFLEVARRATKAERRWAARRSTRGRCRPRRSRSRNASAACSRTTCARTSTCRLRRRESRRLRRAAEGTFGASEEAPRRLRINAETIPTGVAPGLEVAPGTATPTPRAACCRARRRGARGRGHRPRGRGRHRRGAPRAHAGRRGVVRGHDIGSGETVLFAGTRLTRARRACSAAIAARRWRVRAATRRDLSTGTRSRSRRENSARARLRQQTAASSPTRCARSAVIPSSSARSATTRPRCAPLARALGRADLVLLVGRHLEGRGRPEPARGVGARPGRGRHGVALKPGKPIASRQRDAGPSSCCRFPTSACSRSTSSSRP